jgi:hypothetical protein
MTPDDIRLEDIRKERILLMAQGEWIKRRVDVLEQLEMIAAHGMLLDRLKEGRA